MRQCLAFAMALTTAVSSLGHATPASSGDLLDHLAGTWVVSGTTLGKPISTGADAHSEFGGKFTELHIKDPRSVDRYEARVFFGKANNGSLVVHWLDGTGGETSRTLGSGSINGDVVTMTFPYPDGVFRDTFTYDRAEDRWRLLILMGPSDHPKVFSDWYFNRARER